MNGTEILVNTLLKAFGYKKEDMETAIQRILGLQSYVENTLHNLDSRLAHIEHVQIQILAQQVAIMELLGGSTTDNIRTLTFAQ